jgi:hypothetical protein
MAKRPFRTPLYELITSRRDPGEAPDKPPPQGPLWVTAGRTIRLPVGYVLLAGAATLLLLVGAYMFGHWRGAEAQRAAFDRTLLEAGSMPIARDPMQQGGDPATIDDATGELAPPEGTGDSSEGEGGVPGEAAAAWGPVESDPRRAGRLYLVLAETRREGALRLAEYCRTNGLEAYVVGGDNGPRRRVILLPGFATRSDPELRSLMERVDQVGRAWKAEHRGESDLSDKYPHLYEP